jgi:hypothetical protein
VCYGLAGARGVHALSCGRCWHCGDAQHLPVLRCREAEGRPLWVLDARSLPPMLWPCPRMFSHNTSFKTDEEKLFKVGMIAAMDRKGKTGGFGLARAWGGGVGGWIKRGGSMMVCALVRAGVGGRARLRWQSPRQRLQARHLDCYSPWWALAERSLLTAMAGASSHRATQGPGSTPPSTEGCSGSAHADAGAGQPGGPHGIPAG